MWKKTENARYRCCLCGNAIAKDKWYFRSAQQTFRSSHTVNICADHFIFKKCDECEEKMTCVTTGKRADCQIYGGVINGDIR